ncbi:DHS-like NAD/FAD-binding domain-containing protein [Suillus fuscotomentosus]|uniref:DHS-like NAD/FAD-binding domain-containing protein n=1 Tax=Suillus fuscotomentosus TaxID=1912939 RepID=A0AAD4E7K4_9AGAM|nr:DHS-like NAD/FAD-binding domain-containing protein [Suillus fuscotomentosus]KAG1901055.1 DHS-like NAD/FAD-binding domain-containing protein [Suillus fuscotomentosus]
MLDSRCWAFPLCGGSPSHWVLGWVDWSAHEIGFFDSLGIHPTWAQKNLQHAAAGLEHWLKYETYPEIKSFEHRFKDWKIVHHTPPDDQKQKDSWSCGLFVMMAMDGLSNLNFSHVHRSNLEFTKAFALKTIMKVSPVIQQRRSRKDRVPPASVDHAESSSSSFINIAQNNFVSKISGGEEVQKVLDIILHAKNLIVICGPEVSVPAASEFPIHPFESLLPIIWQEPTKSSLVFQTMMHHLKRTPIKNLLYQAIHSLDRRGNLLRVYTQNIDAMEKNTGLLSFGVPKSFQIGTPDCPRCIPLLGRLDQMSCTSCDNVAPSAIFLDQSLSDGLPICTDCPTFTHSFGHHGIRRPNIVVCKEEQPNLNSVLAHDENLVDVVLAVGVHPIPHSNLSGITKQITQAAHSRAQEGIPTSILLNLDTSALERTGIQDLFQVSLALDLQEFFGSIILAAHQDAIHNPASNTMLIPKSLVLNEEGKEEEGDGEDDDGNNHKLLLTLTPWYFPDF